MLSIAVAVGQFLPGDQDSIVVMSHPIFGNTVSIAVIRHDGLLPLTETVQRLVSMMINFQIWLQKTYAKQSDATLFPSVQKKIICVVFYSCFVITLYTV